MKGHILTSLLTVIVFANLQAQDPTPVPRLVVGLTIDQLRLDYVEAFSALYGERGFKRLWKEARIYRNAEYDFVGVDKSSSVATIYSGSSPAVHGIVGDTWLDRSTLRVIDCIDDSHFMGIYSSESTSPVRYKVSNLSDELMIASQGKSMIYSIAPTREMAVLAAGHASNGAFWINDETGKWSGTTYYGAFPTWVTNYNDREGIDFRIDKMVWTPALPLSMYRYLTTEAQPKEFKYKFDNERKAKYRRLKTSPFANEEVNKLVGNCFRMTSMGQDQIPDLLSLAYYAGNYNHLPASEKPLEMQDTYVRLDRCLGNLLDLIDAKVGLKNTLFFITSTGYTDADPLDKAEYRIPTGEFHMKRCAALLNLYLAAIYGEGIYVDGYYGYEIYLNHKLLEQKKLKLDEILARTSEFLVQFSGVKDVYSSYRLKLGSWTPQIDKIKNRFNAVCSGDLWVDILPGWSMAQEHSLNSKVVRHIYSSAPWMLFGWNVKPEIIHTPVNINHLAPTIAHFMRIRAPNAAELSPMTDICQ